MKFILLINTDLAKINGNFGFKSPRQAFIPLILTFMSRMNFILRVEHEKSFKTSWPDPEALAHGK